jgi:hypothetical protein
LTREVSASNRVVALVRVAVEIAVNGSLVRRKANDMDPIYKMVKEQ